VQISGEGFALPDRMVIPVCRHGHEDLPGSDVDASRIRLKYRMFHLLALTDAFALDYLRLRLGETSVSELLTTHRKFKHDIETRAAD
jgi:hypothetical protein